MSRVRKQSGERIQEEREVAFMVDPEANFVSLVSRGANQMPFRVVKHQKPEGSEPMKILHSIIAPADVDENVIKEALGEEASQVVKFDSKAERGDMVAFEQVARDKFKEESFELVTLDAENKIKGIQGELDEDESGNVLTRMFRPARKTEQAIEIDAEADDIEAVKNQLTEEVYMEMMKANDAVAGILAQEKGEPKSKLKAVKQVLKNLTDYIEDALLVTKGDVLDVATKMEEAKAEKETPAEEVVGKSENEDIDETPDEGDGTQKGESAEERQTPAEEVPAEEEQPEDVNQVIKDALGEMKSHLESAMKKLDERIDGMDKRVEAVEGNVEKIQKRVPGTVRSNDADDVDTKQTKQKSENEGSFRGTIFGG